MTLGSTIPTLNREGLPDEKIIFFLFICLSAFSSVSNANDSGQSTTVLLNSARELAFLEAQIKTPQDLKVYVEMTEGRHSPINKLPQNEREKFLNSITWNERGVTGFSYEPFRELSVTETFQILALFGIQHVTPLTRSKIRSITDQAIMNMNQEQSMATRGEGGGFYPYYTDYRCSGRATCSRSTSEICTGNC